MRIGAHDKSKYLRPHSGGVDVEDVHPALLLRKADLHLDLQAAGPQQCLVNHVLSVRHACRSINHCTGVSNSGRWCLSLVSHHLCHARPLIQVITMYLILRTEQKMRVNLKSGEKILQHWASTVLEIKKNHISYFPHLPFRQD
jgi:hypothetical protein